MKMRMAVLRDWYKAITSFCEPRPQFNLPVTFKSFGKRSVNHGFSIDMCTAAQSQG